ncbi:uncharacterized protein LOC124282911 [Haliotis rubra]|uniref:uncharacterized protein LOC124282911 n=1 Tax=Haliotis rubra TaxID=36100 RepID=UPI001EE54C7C|nr:uncharacterized protein LOC124282911 [Haliotis rubra]
MFLNTICTFVVVLMACHVEKGGAQLPSFTTDLSLSTGCTLLEEGPQISFNLIRSGGAFGPSFTTETLDDSATFPADYTLPMGTSGTFTVSPNFEIVIVPVDDGITEGEESFTLRFSAIG